jgi:hypothetical protein
MSNRRDRAEKSTKGQLKDLEIKIIQSYASAIKWMVGTIIAFSGIIIAATPLIIKYL